MIGLGSDKIENNKLILINYSNIEDNNNDNDVKVEDAVRAISNVDDYAGSAKALAATTLRFSLSS